jgi:hypothetical protein
VVDCAYRSFSKERDSALLESPLFLSSLCTSFLNSLLLNQVYKGDFENGAAEKLPETYLKLKEHLVVMKPLLSFAADIQSEGIRLPIVLLNATESLCFQRSIQCKIPI